MAIRKILTYPNPLLMQKSTDVEKVDRSIKELVKDMAETMYRAPGIGLAAPQVGALKNIIVVDVASKSEDSEPQELVAREPTPKESGLVVLINPKILKRDGSVFFDEACLSVPDLLVKVKRSSDITVCGLNENGKNVELDCGGLLAIAIQHEMDHLNGVLIVDYASYLKRALYLKKLKKKEQSEKEE